MHFFIHLFTRPSYDKYVLFSRHETYPNLGSKESGMHMNFLSKTRD